MRTTAFLLVAAAAAFWAGATTRSETTAAPPTTEGVQPAAAAVERPFAHPIYIHGKANTSPHVEHVLEKAEVRRLAGRSFVVGTVMKDSPRQLTGNHFAGDTVWVPLDDVASIIELTPRPKP